MKPILSFHFSAFVLASISLCHLALGQNEPEINFHSSKTQERPAYAYGAMPIPGAKSGVMPIYSDQTHGWRLQSPKRGSPVRVREILTMSGPGTWQWWDRTKTFSVSPRRDSCTVTWTDYGNDGWIEGSWLIQATDPRGTYYFEIFFDDRRVALIPFEVQ
jgi:hypothetical protein